MKWFERQLERLRSLNPLVVDGGLAVVVTIFGVATVVAQPITDGQRQPNALAILTLLLVTAPITVRRRAPLLATCLASFGIWWHITAGFPEGSLPIALVLLTYSLASSSTLRHAVAGLAISFVTLSVLGIGEAPGLDTLGVLGNVAVFSICWLAGLAVQARRETEAVLLRSAEERADVERQRSARLLAEERLSIAQELHDVVAHSMSVIAVQAGVGAHVLDRRPDQARVALEAISATSRGTLTEMRRLLGVLRDDQGQCSSTPAPALIDMPRLIAEVRAAGVPVNLLVEGSEDSVNPGVELSAYRVVQEALTNVIKHAGATTRVDVRVTHLPDTLSVEITDDGLGTVSATPPSGNRSGSVGDESHLGHGLVGMRERVKLWGGELSAGPITGGGYRVKAILPNSAPT